MDLRRHAMDQAPPKLNACSVVPNAAVAPDERRGALLDFFLRCLLQCSSPLRLRTPGVGATFAALTIGCALSSSAQVGRLRDDLGSEKNGGNEFSHREGWEGSADVDDWEPLRLLGRSMVDFTLRYYKELHARPVRALVKPGYLKASKRSGAERWLKGFGLPDPRGFDGSGGFSGGYSTFDCPTRRGSE